MMHLSAFLKPKKFVVTKRKLFHETFSPSPLILSLQFSYHLILTMLVVNIEKLFLAYSINKILYKVGAVDFFLASISGCFFAF